MRKPSKQLKKLGVYDVPLQFRPFVTSKITGAEVGAEKTEIKFNQHYSILGKILFCPLAFILHWIKYGICGLADFVPFNRDFRLVVKNEAINVNDLLWLDDEVPSFTIKPDLTYFNENF